MINTDSFIVEQLQKIKKRNLHRSETELRLLLYSKLVEEVGELTEKLLCYFEYQRVEKIKTFMFKDLEEEFADVYICLLLLSKELKINLDTSISEKIKEVNKRFKEWAKNMY